MQEQQLVEAAQTVSRFSLSPTSYFFLGLGVGAPAGFYYGRRFAKEKLRAEIMAEADAEVDSMRDHFERKEVALLQREERRTAEELAAERGYSVKADPAEEGSVRVLRPPVPVREPETTTEEEEETGHTQVIPAGGSILNWDFKKEVAGRTGTKPYVIHHSEMQELEGFNQVSYEYYPVDNVLVDEDGQQIERVDDVVGSETLSLFGHGSDDPNVVFVRNNALRLHIEIQNLPGRSYAVDVLGLSDEPAS